MLYNLHFFPSKCRLFHSATLFGFCITHILNAGCAKIWKKKIRRQKFKTARYARNPQINAMRCNVLSTVSVGVY